MQAYRFLRDKATARSAARASPDHGRHRSSRSVERDRLSKGTIACVPTFCRYSAKRTISLYHGVERWKECLSGRRQSPKRTSENTWAARLGKISFAQQDPENLVDMNW